MLPQPGLPQVPSKSDSAVAKRASSRALALRLFSRRRDRPKGVVALFCRNQKLMYGLLMQVSAAVVKDLCADKRHLGALPGLLSVLHTWNGRLDYHPHVHLLITGGGITPDGQHWQPARGKFLVPVFALSRKIASRFCAALEAEAPAIFAEVSADVWRREWVSFCKHYGHGNDAVLTYLSRYVFRTAITNARILDMDQTHVTFRWKDREAGAWRIERLPGVEFLSVPPARLAARVSQGPILRALAPLEARPIQPCLGAIDAGYAGRPRQAAESHKPLRALEPTHGTHRSSP